MSVNMHSLGKFFFFTFSFECAACEEFEEYTPGSNLHQDGIHVVGFLMCDVCFYLLISNFFMSCYWLRNIPFVQATLAEYTTSSNISKIDIIKENQTLYFSLKK